MAISEWRGVLRLDATDAAATPTDYSSSIVDITINMKRTLEEYHTIDSIDPKSMPGGRMVEITVTALSDSAFATAVGTMNTATRTLEWGEPDRATAGSRTFTAEVHLGDRDMVYGAVGGSAKARMTKFTFKTSGAITEGVVT